MSHPDDERNHTSHPYDQLTRDGLAARRSMKWNAYPPDVVPAWVAEMDFPLAEPITRVLHEMVRESDTGYPWPAGLAETYAAFSHRRYGVEPGLGGAGLVPDIMRGVRVALERLTPADSAVAFLTPAYPPFFEFVEAAGRQVRTVPMVRSASGRYELDAERLQRTLADPDVSAFLLCQPHNPTGRVFDLNELHTIALAANRAGVLVLSDEVHAPLTYPDEQHLPYTAVGELTEYSVTFVSASKGWNIPGLKCALAIGNGTETRRVFGDLPVEVQAGASPLGVAANIAAFGESEPWLDDTVAYLDRNRAFLERTLSERLPAARYSSPQATYLAWVDCRDLGLGDEPAQTFLTDGRVALNSGVDYGEDGRGFVRLNFGTSAGILAEAVDRMAAAAADTAPVRE